MSQQAPCLKPWAEPKGALSHTRSRFFLILAIPLLPSYRLFFAFFPLPVLPCQNRPVFLASKIYHVKSMCCIFKFSAILIFGFTLIILKHDKWYSSANASLLLWPYPPLPQKQKFSIPTLDWLKQSRPIYFHHQKQNSFKQITPNNGDRP
jgi:hypothetical protein